MRRPRTVLHLLGSAGLEASAQARIVAALARGLDPERYRVEAAFVDHAGPLVDQLTALGVPSREAIFRGKVDVLGALRVAAGVRGARPAIVQLHVGGRSRVWLVRAISAAKLVAHVHGTHGEDGKPVPLEEVLGKVDAVVATSTAVAEAVEQAATVVYPGVEVPAEAGISSPGREPIIGIAARLEPIKGLSTLIEAAAALRQRHPTLRVEVAGTGSCEPALRDLTRDLDMDEAVRFLGWRRDVEALHRRWRVFVLPSVYEGFGIGVLEAMASGIPVVASNTGGLPELVDHDRTGFLFPAGDVAALAHRLDALLTDEKLCARMGTAGRERAMQRFTIPQMAARMSEVYDRVIEGDRNEGGSTRRGRAR